jgi:hypothetical protein
MTSKRHSRLFVISRVRQATAQQATPIMSREGNRGGLSPLSHFLRLFHLPPLTPRQKPL